MVTLHADRAGIWTDSFRELIPNQQASVSMDAPVRRIAFSVAGESNRSIRLLFAGMHPAPMSQRIAARLNALLALPRNWDTYGASRVSDHAALCAMTWTMQHLDKFAETPPSIVPLANGGIQFEWHRGGSDLEIEFEPSGRAVFMFVPLVGSEREGVLDSSNGFGKDLVQEFLRGVAGR